MVKDESGERKLTAYERWELPNLERGEPAPNIGQSALAIREEAFEVDEEISDEELVYEPLTAQQLEEIRSAAYEEGFIQGEADGYQKGMEEGHAAGVDQGLAEGREQGHQEGLAQALAEGTEQAQLQLEVLEQTLNALVGELQSPLEDSRDALERLLAQTVRNMVSHITERELTDHAEALLTRHLTSALNRLSEFSGRIKVKVHPDVLEAAEALQVSSRLNLQFETDSGLLPGGFIIDSQAFHLDGRVETAMAAIFDGFAKEQE